MLPNAFRQGYETCDVQMGSTELMRKMLIADKGILLSAEVPTQWHPTLTLHRRIGTLGARTICNHLTSTTAPHIGQAQDFLPPGLQRL